MEVTRYMGWRRLMSGYPGGGDQSDIDNQVSAFEGQDTIPGIGTFDATYIVTNIEDSPDVAFGKFFLLTIIN